jgi:hypothetical protein
MTTEIAQILTRRGTTAEWTAANPVVLGDGELAIDETLNTIKIGDGSTAYASLANFNIGLAQVEVDQLANIGASTISAAQWAYVGNMDQDVASADSVAFADITTDDIVLSDGGTIGQAAGPLLTFDDTNNYLEITGCNVGFGTATPARLGHFKSTGSTEVRIESAVAGASALELADTAVRWTIYKPASTTDLRFYDGTADRVTILNGGNVGFGTTSPDVLGHIMNSDASALWHANTYLAVENNGFCVVSIGSSAASQGALYFSDSGSSSAGQVLYDHTDDSMDLVVNGSTVALTLASDGGVYAPALLGAAPGSLKAVYYNTTTKEFSYDNS